MSMVYLMILMFSIYFSVFSALNAHSFLYILVHLVFEFHYHVLKVFNHTQIVVV
jgi:hypothetical protein